MSSYRALVFDIDGTAVPNRPDGMPSQRLIDTVQRYRSDLVFIAATGRPIKSALPIFEALGLSELCIVSGGTVIFDLTARIVVQHTALPQASLQALISLTSQHPYPFYLRDERFITGSQSSALAGDIEVALIGEVPADAVEQLHQAVNAIPELIGMAVPDWNGTGTAIIITHRDATKEHAVAEVLGRLGIAKDEAIGIGDGNIDLHLFRSVGLKIAMGNANPELKAAADLIAPSVDEDGLAHIIERYAGQRILTANRD